MTLLLKSRCKWRKPYKNFLQPLLAFDNSNSYVYSNLNLQLMHKLLPILALMLFANGARAQRFLNEVFPSFSKTSNITYAQNISVLTTPPQSVDLKMDIYQPDGATDTMARRPLIIMLHSGSFLPPYVNTQLDGGRNDSGIVNMCRSFAKRGYVVANVDYRLGWAASSSDLDVRRGTLINAFVRAIQDVKAAVRYFRKDAATTNTYKIDSNRVIVGGVATGGALAVNYAVLQTQAQLGINKFRSGTTNPTYGFVAGQPYVNPAIIGDLDGYGGNPAFNNPNNSPGYGGKANFIFAFEAIVGDSSWVVPGLPPMVSVHRQNLPTNTQPYGHGTVFVNIGGPQPVVDVSGSGYFIPRTNAAGNNACFAPNNFTDPITQKAMQLSGGQEGLYPVQSNTASITWYDSTSSVTECQGYGLSAAQCNGIFAQYAAINNKTQNLLYQDTFMRYLNPRIVQCFYGTAGVSEVAAEEAGFVVSPNPSNGEVSVVTSGNAGRMTTIAVRELTGKTVQQVSLRDAQSTTLRLNGLPSGMYILFITTADGATTSQRLVIQH